MAGTKRATRAAAAAAKRAATAPVDPATETAVPDAEAAIAATPSADPAAEPVADAPRSPIAPPPFVAASVPESGGLSASPEKTAVAPQPDVMAVDSPMRPHHDARRPTELAPIRLGVSQLPSFSGKEDFGTWAAQVQAIAGHLRLDDSSLRAAILAQLRDEAAAYLTTAMATDDTAHDLIERLRSVYGAVSSSAAVDLLMEARQQAGEAVTTFFARIVRLAAAADVSDPRTHFYHGLLPAVRHHVANRLFVTNGGKVPPVAEVLRLAREAPAPAKATPLLTAAVGLPRGRTPDGQIVCYGCRQPGHIRAKCPNRRTIGNNNSTSTERQIVLARKTGGA